MGRIEISDILHSAQPIRYYRLPKMLEAQECAPFDTLEIAWNEDLEIAAASPLPAAKDLADFYNTRYRRVMGKAHSFDTYLKSPNYRAQVRSQANWILPTLTHNSSVLDVGAGFGLLLWQISEDRAGCQLNALEPDKDAREQLARLATVYTDFDLFWCGDVFSNGSFDVITLSHVLEHLRDPIAALCVLKNYLKPGGHLMIEVPNDPLEVLLDRERKSDLPHLWFFSENGLAHICDAVGLQVVRSATIGIRRRQVKAALPVRVHRRVMRMIHGPHWSEPSWYGEGQDRNDLRILCRVPLADPIES